MSGVEIGRLYLECIAREEEGKQRGEKVDMY